MVALPVKRRVGGPGSKQKGPLRKSKGTIHHPAEWKGAREGGIGPLCPPRDPLVVSEKDHLGMARIIPVMPGPNHPGEGAELFSGYPEPLSSGLGPHRNAHWKAVDLLSTTAFRESPRFCAPCCFVPSGAGARAQLTQSGSEGFNASSCAIKQIAERTKIVSRRFEIDN